MLNHLSPHSWLLFWSYKILQNLTKLLQNLPMMFFAILLFNYQAANSEHHVRWIPPNPTKFLEIEPKKSTNHQKTKPFQVGHHIPLISLWYTMIYHIYIYFYTMESPPSPRIGSAVSKISGTLVELRAMNESRSRQRREIRVYLSNQDGTGSWYPRVI